MTGDVKMGASAFTLYTAPQTMITNSSPSPFVASASNEYYPAYYAFNSDQNDYWSTAIYYNDTTGVYNRTPATTNTWGGTAYTGEYIKIDLGAIYKIKNYYVRSSSANYIETTPSIWYVGVSTDNITYTLWDSRSGEAWASQATKTYSPASNATARYIIFVVNKTGSGGTSFRSQPRIASLYFDYETFNYDITLIRNMTSYTLITSGAITASGLITVSAGLTGTTLTASGLITANAGVDMKSQILSNVGTPSASTDGATKGYIDTLDGQNVKLTGTLTIAGTKEFSGILATSLGVPCIVGRNTKGTGATGGLELYGTSGNINGPHIQAFVHDSVYPTFQLLNWSQDNITLNFDSYYDGSAWKSSDPGSNFQISKGSDKLAFNYKSGVVLAGNITLSEAMNISNAGVISANAGMKIGIQVQTNGTNARGIFMWDTADSNWGIYMGQSGASKSLSGGTAPAGNGFSSYSLRFRVANDATNGFVWENSSNNAAMSLRGSDGFLWCSGGFQTDNGITINNSTATLFFTDGTTTTCGICWTDYNHGIFCKRNSDQMYFKEYGTCYFQTTGSNTRATLTSAGIVNTSDRRHKTDIRNIKFCGLDFINALKPKCFKLRESKRENCGFIAQDIEELVEKKLICFNPVEDHKVSKGDGTTEELKTMNYFYLIAPIVKAVQELSEKVNYLEKENKTLLNIQQDQANQLAELRTEVFPT